jgi:excisionase family DNA binding protein
MENHSAEELLTLQETARYLKVDPRTVFRMIHRGELPAIKIGRLWRIKWAQMTEWIASRPRLAWTLQESFPGLQKELMKGLHSLYSSRLKGVYLYGSYARGQARPDSDLDLLLVLEDFSDVGEELRRTSGLTSDLSLKHGVPVTLLPVRAADFETRHTPLLINVRREAMRLSA